MNAPLVIAMAQGKEIVLLPNMANRHGLITGATGTGKTVTLQKMAESFASLGVPVFMADVKGDLSGIGAAGVGWVLGGAAVSAGRSGVAVVGAALARTWSKTSMYFGGNSLGLRSRALSVSRASRNLVLACST